MTTKHTPTPWKVNKEVDENCKGGCGIESEKDIVVSVGCGDCLTFAHEYLTVANAEFIVRACNNHGALLAALKQAQITLDRICDWLANDYQVTHASDCGLQDGPWRCTCFVSTAPDARDSVESAIAAAEKKA